MSRKPPPTREQLLTGRLNDTGFPFQDLCADVAAKQTGWHAVAEVPYTYPPSNAAVIGESGAIDVLALLPDLPPELDRDRMSVWVVAECKRASPAIKTWVFVRDPTPRVSSFIIGGRMEGDNRPLSACMTVALAGLGYPLGVYPITHQAFECNEALAALNRRHDEKVYRPMRQANHGLTALAEGWVAIPDRLPSVPSKGCLYIPVVVTTAELVVASYAPSSVDAATGLAPEDAVVYEAAQWIPHAFPLPDFMTVQKSYSRTTFVVQALHWASFLNGLLDFTLQREEAPTR